MSDKNGSNGSNTNGKPPIVVVRTVPSVVEYKRQDRATNSERIAHYWEWSAKKYPGAYSPPNLIAKAIFGLKKQPSLNSREVEIVRSSMGRAKEILHTTYKRGACYRIGVGSRGSINTEDRLKNSFVNKFNRLESYSITVAKEAAAIDVNKIPDTDANRPLRRWFTGHAKPVLKLSETLAAARKALPAASTIPAKPTK